MQFLTLVFLFLVHIVSGNLDLDALLELKKGFKEEPLRGNYLSSWNINNVESNNGGCPQSWYGIDCEGGHVTAIVLSNLGLVGSFNFSVLVGLGMIQNLSISNNQFTGIISPDIGSIGSLRLLDLSANSFHGSIPYSLIKMENLALLNLSSNSFGGTVPVGVGQLEQLRYLDLRCNRFYGDIAGVLMQLQKVVYVDLSSNRFSGYLDLGLANASFVSTVQYLNVSHNKLGGELFAHDGMPFFDNLEVFDASHNQIIGRIPSFNFVVSLRILRLGSNQLSGSLSSGLLQESSMVLTELDLSFNHLEGPVESITSASLRTLNLSSNNLVGSLPTRVGHCAVIDFSCNMLSGNMSRIQTWGNYIEVIYLSSNSLTGTLPNRTSQFLRLTSLVISNNSLEGTLPSVLGFYPELTVIDLSLNQLNGPLPSNLFNSSRLLELNLSKNKLFGPIPLSFTQNLSLTSLDLSENLLTGVLPPEISKLYDLVYLDLSNNHLEGGIPNDLPDGLQRFNVSYNNFSGVVPENLLRFPVFSFHPGNFLLFFPHPSSLPKDISQIKSQTHLSHAIRIALISCFLGLFAGIVLLSSGIYYISRKQPNRHGRNSFNDPKGISSQSPSPSPEIASINVNVLRGTEIGVLESRARDHVISSPASLFSTSTSYMHSPDKFAGDLHLFDSSYMFTLEEFSRAPAEVIGRSCHGTSYKATLSSGHVLIIKWLREGVVKGKKDFAREVKKLGNIKHPNVVSLRGYYWGPKEHERVVISAFVDASCLSLHLYGAELRELPPLSFNQRLKIAMDISCCLNYLHNEKAIPHGNLKTSNILLQNPDLNPLLTDYSLHRIMNPSGTAEQVLNAGALGYRPPEFANSSKPCPSLKSDVYAFGVILLELLTGKCAGEIVSAMSGAVDLTDWVRMLASGSRWTECFDRLMISDNDIVKDALPKGVHEMLQVGLKCILPASERPDIRTVFEDLSSIVL